MKLLKQIQLLFDGPEVREDLSGVVFSSHQYLWLGTNEFTRIERLKRIDENTFAEHRVFQFKELIEEFENEEGEVDVEGIDWEDGYLWVIGSHSSKRKKAKGDKVGGDELKEVIKQANRYLLARIPVNDQGDLVKHHGFNNVAWLKRKGNTSSLIEALEDDEYLGGILKSNLPSKDNGFDLEGLAVRNNKILIGLRGPVLRGTAILLEIEVEEGGDHQLRLKKIGEGDKRYKRDFLALDGLGIRELCLDGDELLVLAGPTMDLDGSTRLFRLKEPFGLDDRSLSTQKNLQSKSTIFNPLTMPYRLTTTTHKAHWRPL